MFAEKSAHTQQGIPEKSSGLANSEPPAECKKFIRLDSVIMEEKKIQTR